MDRFLRYFSIFRAALLVSGTTIGAGMLGLPLVTAVCGFVPGVVITVLVWAFMLLTGLLFLEATLWCEDGANILSIGKRYLGLPGKLLGGALFIFLYYCLMVAYFAAGGSLFHQFLHFFLSNPLSFTSALFLFGLIFGSVVAIGPRSIDKSNVVLSICMVCAWILLVVFGAKTVSVERLIPAEWGLMPYAAPVIFSAFGFHNIVPSLATHMKRERKPLIAAIVLGTVIPLVVYLVWQWLLIGAVSHPDLQSVIQTGQPVTIALGMNAQNTLIPILGDCFAFFAIVTSVLGVSFSMVDFFADGLSLPRKGVSRLFLTALVFIPPFFFSYTVPGIFTSALGVAGGIGEAFINGIFPILIVYVGRERMREAPLIGPIGSKAVLALLFLCAAGVAALEIYALLTPHLLEL